MPVLDVKHAFHTALEEAGIEDFTWHDFRHGYASRLVMAGVSLRAVAELLCHKGLRMVMRYAMLPLEADENPCAFVPRAYGAVFLALT